MPKAIRRKLIWLSFCAVLACTGFMFAAVNPKFLHFALSLRLPTLSAILISAFAIGAASLVFQTLVQNNILTPCLLGMNSLYLLLHTVLVFTAGLGSFIVTNPTLAFCADLLLMALTAVFLYSYIFKKTRYNVLYVMLIGTVLTTFFTSLQNTLVRIMDPADYDALLTTLTASFTHVNTEILIAAPLVLLGTALWLRRDLQSLDAMSLGRSVAINLGIDYDRTMRRLLLGVTLYIAVATALVGPLSFMGLITTNLARALLPTFRHSALLAGSVLFGVLILAAGELLTEHVFVFAVPVSVFITVFGGAYFLYLILRTTGGRHA